MAKPTGKQMTPLIQSEDKRAKQEARQAIMARRLSLGIISENFSGACLLSDVGTPEQVQALREKWGLL